MAAAIAVAGMVGWSAPASADGLFGSGDLQLQGGGFVAVSPKYEGSNEYRVIGAPFIAPANLNPSGFVQFKGPDDVRFRVLNLYGFEAGPVLGYRFDRDQDDADRLNGLGDVDGGLLVGGFGAYNFGPIKAFASYATQVTGDETGGVLRFGGEGRFNLTPAIIMTATVGATWADDDFMDSYFGVTAAQAGRSGLTQFDAESGVKDVYVGLAGDVALDARWTLKLSGRYSRLVGDAADSPVIETENQFFGGLGLTYKFTLPR